MIQAVMRTASDLRQTAYGMIYHVSEIHMALFVKLAINKYVDAP